MADPIRPTLTPAAPATRAPQANAQAVAAQRAFFQTALNKTAPAWAPAPPTVAARSAATPAAPKAAAEPQPTRYLRPGSKVDITV